MAYNLHKTKKLIWFFEFCKMADKRRVIENACRLFLKRGCKAVTMDDIASDNGISKRTLYEMFKDKSDLLAQCMMVFHVHGIEHFKKLRAKSDNTVDFIINILRQEEQDKEFMEFHNVFLKDVKKVYPEVFDNVGSVLNKSIFSIMVEIFEEGQRSGYIISNVVDARSMALFVINMVANSRDRTTFEGMEVDWDYSPLEVVLLFARGLCTPKGIEIIDKFLIERRK